MSAPPDHSRLRRYVHQHTKDWSARIDGADALVVVTPEYDYSYPAAVNNALDYLHEEWQYKPVGFVSHGGVAAGRRAVQQFEQVVTTLKMVPVTESVNLPFHASFMDEDGRFQGNGGAEQAADTMLDELGRVEAALRPLRPRAAQAA